MNNPENHPNPATPQEIEIVAPHEADGDEPPDFTIIDVAGCLSSSSTFG